jgi:hypothetical protein
LRNLPGGQIQLPADGKPAEMGNQIARAVHSGLGSLRPAKPAIRGRGWR